MDRECGERSSKAPIGTTSRKENSGAVQNGREALDKNTKHPLQLQF